VVVRLVRDRLFQLNVSAVFLNAVRNSVLDVSRVIGVARVVRSDRHDPCGVVSNGDSGIVTALIHGARNHQIDLVHVSRTFDYNLWDEGVCSQNCRSRRKTVQSLISSIRQGSQILLLTLLDRRAASAHRFGTV